MAKLNKLQLELDRVAQELSDPNAKVPALDPIPERHLVTHVEPEILADNATNLSPRAVLERIRLGMTRADVDKIAEHWVHMWQTSSNPAWARLFADHMLPKEEAISSPLELFIRELGRQNSAKSTELSTDDELAGYLEVKGNQDIGDV